MTKRRQFGAPLSERDLVRELLAEMATDFAARVLSLKCLYSTGTLPALGEGRERGKGGMVLGSRGVESNYWHGFSSFGFPTPLAVVKIGLRMLPVGLHILVIAPWPSCVGLATAWLVNDSKRLGDFHKYGLRSDLDALFSGTGFLIALPRPYIPFSVIRSETH